MFLAHPVSLISRGCCNYHFALDVALLKRFRLPRAHQVINENRFVISLRIRLSESFVENRVADLRRLSGECQDKHAKKTIGILNLYN